MLNLTLYLEKKPVKCKSIMRYFIVSKDQLET